MYNVCVCLFLFKFYCLKCSSATKIYIIYVPTFVCGDMYIICKNMHILYKYNMYIFYREIGLIYLETYMPLVSIILLSTLRCSQLILLVFFYKKKHVNYITCKQ